MDAIAFQPASVTFEPLGTQCPVCESERTEAFEAKEMMFGTQETFRYGACTACGILWLLDVPADLSPYYPESYYSFQRKVKVATGAKKWAKTVWAHHHLDRPTLAGRVLASRFPQPPFFEWMRRSNARFDSRILDVGSGRGHLLHEMAGCGFSNLVGADPYLTDDETGADGVRLYRRTLDQLEGPFDVVMAHHAFEHMPDPAAQMKEMARLLAPDGTLLLRIPVADSEAWQVYGTDWVALDAPRHLFLHTNASIARLADEAGLAVREVVNDAGAMTCWGSEQYRRGIPLYDGRSYGVNPEASGFSAGDIQRFAAQVAAWNAAGVGDTRAYYLRRR